MRGEVNPQSSMFHYFSVDSRIPADHPLRLVKKLADSARSAISAELDGLYAKGGRPSIAPERLLKAQWRIAFSSVRSDRQFCEPLDDKLLFRWFLDLDVASGGLGQSNFSRWRERRVQTDLARRFFDEVLRLARKDQRLSSDHFTVDGALIDACALICSSPMPPWLNTLQPASGLPVPGNAGFIPRPWVLTRGTL
jgi:transposase